MDSNRWGNKAHANQYQPLLYNIIADSFESKNLTIWHLDMVKRFSAKVEAWVTTLPKEYQKTKHKDD